MSSVVVIPNHLAHLRFLDDLMFQCEGQDVEFIVIQDVGAKPELRKKLSHKVTIYDHTDIENDLKDRAWIIPSRSSACRSYGYYKAWQLDPEMILTIDNDCAPENSEWIPAHLAALKTPVDSKWSQTADVYTRGFPYNVRGALPTQINHGLWSWIPDLDAPTQLQNPHMRFKVAMENIRIPQGEYFPMCGMNLAWRPEATPILYFGLQGPDYPFDRFDDIWAGIIMKKIADHLGWGVRSGSPSVRHTKQSDVFENLKKEAPGIQVNEYFWERIDRRVLTGTTPIECYRELGRTVTAMDAVYSDYWAKLGLAMQIWADLFETGRTPLDSESS